MHVKIQTKKKSSLQQLDVKPRQRCVSYIHRALVAFLNTYQVDGTDLNKEEKRSPDKIIDPCSILFSHFLFITMYLLKHTFFPNI